MRTCPKCGASNPDDRDFCACGEYLRWEPTAFIPAVKPPAPEPVEAPRSPSPPPAAAQPDAAPPAPSPPGPPPLDPQFVTRARPAAPPLPTAPPPSTAPPPPAARAPAQPPPLPDPAAAITLRLPRDQPRAGDETLAATVVPGERVRVLALVRNQSQIVDNFELVVHGLPDDWWTVNPQTAYLVPFGSAGSYEQEIEIVLHPPRTPAAEARPWELSIGVQSGARQEEVAAAPFTLGILPFEQYEVRVRPERASGRLRAKYVVRVTNQSNAVVLVALDAADGDGACRFAFESDVVEVPTGSAQTVRLRARPPGHIWIGRAVDRRFEIFAATGEAGEQLLAARGDAGGGRKPGKLPKIRGVTPPKVSAPNVSIGPDGPNIKAPAVRGPAVRVPQAKPINLARPTLGLRALKKSDGAAPAAPPPPLQPKQAIFRHKAWLPWWLSIAVPLLALVGLLLFMLLPEKVAVPDLRGSKGVFAAQQALTEAGLTLGAREKRPSKQTLGTVLAQSPAPGTEVEENSAVSIEVAVSTDDATVPKLAGLTLPAADKKLRGAGLTMGATSVAPPDLKAKIASTLPDAGESVKAGSPVDIFYDAGAGGKDGSTPAGGKGGDIAVPKIEPSDVQGYGEALTKAGLVPGATEKQISDAEPGAVFATVPAVGTKLAKGAKVALLVSAGFPLMAFDKGDNVVLADAGTGKRVTPAIAKTAAPEKDATFSADGASVIFTSSQRLMLADAAKRGRAPIPLRPETERYADPSFAPTADKRLLAVARINGDDRADTDLCVGRVTIDDYSPQCLRDERFAVGFAHWSPDGRTILVGATSAKGFGIVRYRSAVAFSARRSDWGEGRFVTPRSPTGGVRDAAVSPDGKRLAAIADLDGGPPVLYLAKAADLALKEATKLEVQACKVVWLDSRWLAAVKLGGECKQDTGEIVRISVDTPSEATTITTDGDNPAFQPFNPGG